VFLFGFSRGAAAAQALARFIDWCGGLPRKDDAYYLPRLFRAYVTTRGERAASEALTAIDRERRRDGLEPLSPFVTPEVEFLGAWDTVMALGSRFRSRGESTSSRRRSFHVGEAPPRCVRHARQALAIDESRYDFRPEVWRRSEPGQTLGQRWFAGVHSNIGGGYVDDGLANIALQWMLDEARGCGLSFDEEYARVFRAYPQDRLYRSESWRYRLLDAARGRVGRGRREMRSWPPTATMTLAPAVIHRLRADPGEQRPLGDLRAPRFPELRAPYRPLNLLRFLADQPDLAAYLAELGLETEHRLLPEDVERRLAALRRRRLGRLDARPA
jgi:hypothetical protein